MTSLPRTTDLPLRRLGAALFTVTVLAGGLSACGSNGATDTTCGDFKSQSDSDKRDTIKDAAKDDGGDDADAISNASDTELDLVAKVITSACDSQGDDTKIKDIDPNNVDPSDIASDLGTDLPTSLPS